MKSTRRAFLSAGGASALALSLAACSKSQKTKTAATQASGTPIAEPVLNDKQLSEILQRVQVGLETADKEKNAEKLKEVRLHGSVRPSTPRPPPAGTTSSSTL